MIIDLKKFIQKQRPYWTRLEQYLDSLEKNPEQQMDLEKLRDFSDLYQRASADLARIATFSSEDSMRGYLEALVARAYAEIYESRKKTRRISPVFWFFNTFPQVFRKHIAAFWLSLIITMAGFVFGGMALSLDTQAKQIIMPWSHLLMDPEKRVEKEENPANKDELKGSKTYFSSFLMTHNIKVSIATMALGMTWGIGTILMLFYNGILLGAVATDYIFAGQAKFMIGWLLPHGSVEIPAILLAGQAGFILAMAMIGRNSISGVKQRLKDISNDVITLVFGLSVLLVWAGIIEAFFSQYHEPIFPYWLKIAFGAAQLSLLILFLARSGKKIQATAQ